MSWDINKAMEFLPEIVNRPFNESTNPKGMKCFTCDPIYTSGNIYNNNMISYYGYGLESGEIRLLELGLSTQSEKYLNMAMTKFKELVLSLIELSTGSIISGVELSKDTILNLGEYQVNVCSPEDFTVKVFVTRTSSSEQDLLLRICFLYPDNYKFEEIKQY